MQNLFAIAIGITINFVHEHVDPNEGDYDMYPQDLLERMYQALQFAEGDEENPAGFIDSVFGFDSNLTKEDFIKKSSKSNSCWIYDDITLREKVKATFGTEN